MVVGCLAGLAAVTLKGSVHWIQKFLKNFDFFSIQSYYAIFPLIGLIITYFFATHIFKDPQGHGVSTILRIISKGSSRMKRRWVASRMFTSAITVGFGGSVGLEAPIVLTGSAIGSNIGKELHLNYKMRTLLIGCGAAGAVAGIFNSPIAGVIFAIEVILADVSIRKFIPLLLAAVSGSLIAQICIGDELLFHFTAIEQEVAPNLLHYIGLGVFCGFMSVYFERTHYYIETRIESLKQRFSRPIIGGIGLALIILFLPPLYGEGYDTLSKLINNQESALFQDSLFNSSLFSMDNTIWFLLLILFTIMMKAVASSLTIGAGGGGGVFAPSMFVGGLSGFLYTQCAKYFGFGGSLSSANFTLIGMCGVLSAVLHAPLTGIFLIAEITGGYTLFVPLMIVSAISYLTNYYFESSSFYTKHLIEKGELLMDKDQQVLALIDAEKYIEKDFITVHPEATLGDLIKVVKNSHRHHFPVVNSECRLMGIISLDDIRSIMFEKELYDEVLVQTLMHLPEGVIDENDSLPMIMKKFETTHCWNLPVVYNDVYMGFYSKSKIFDAYRRRLKKVEKDFDE